MTAKKREEGEKGKGSLLRTRSILHLGWKGGGEEVCQSSDVTICQKRGARERGVNNRPPRPSFGSVCVIIRRWAGMVCHGEVAV